VRIKFESTIFYYGWDISTLFVLRIEYLLMIFEVDSQDPQFNV